MRQVNKKGLDLIKKMEGVVSFVYLCQAGHPTIGCGHKCLDGESYLKGYSVSDIKDKINNNPIMISNDSRDLYKVKSSAEIADITFITNKEIDKLLKKDISWACRAVEEFITVHLNDNQFSALVSFTFNLGRKALQGSTLRRKLNQGKYGEVPDELNKYVYARVNGEMERLDVLVKRRKAEGQLFLQNPTFV